MVWPILPIFGNKVKVSSKIFVKVGMGPPPKRGFGETGETPHTEKINEIR